MIDARCGARRIERGAQRLEEGNPQPVAGVIVVGRFFRRRAMQRRSAMETTGAMLGTGHDESLYAAGWTISGLATLATIVAVWVFGI